MQKITDNICISQINLPQEAQISQIITYPDATGEANSIQLDYNMVSNIAVAPQLCSYPRGHILFEKTISKIDIGTKEKFANLLSPHINIHDLDNGWYFLYHLK